MTSPAPDLVELAQAYDVAVDYWDWQGRHVREEVPFYTGVRKPVSELVRDLA